MKSILSLQSNVLRGKVGHVVSREVYTQFVIPCHFIDTVYFSGVASQKQFGIVYDSDTWLNFVREAIEFLQVEMAILHTGYFGSAKQMCAVQETINSEIFVVVDPVMGDNGKLYVDKFVVEKYESFLYCATVITPNLFELETLCQSKINSVSDIHQCVERLFKRWQKLECVIVTSVKFCTSQNNIVIVMRDGRSLIVEKQNIREAKFSGCGDVFTSLFCCYYYVHRDIVHAAKYAINDLYDLIYFCHQKQLGFLDINLFFKTRREHKDA